MSQPNWDQIRLNQGKNPHKLKLKLVCPNEDCPDEFIEFDKSTIENLGFSYTPPTCPHCHRERKIYDV
jgi:hypothetical protein